MTPFSRITATMLCAVLSCSAMASAEEPAAAVRPTVAASSTLPRDAATPVRQWTAREALRSSPSPSRSAGAQGALIGAIVGGVAATAVVYSISKAYGENEGGGFCGGCFAAWGAWAIPAGALGGAAIGYGIGKASSPQYASPVPRTVIAPVRGRGGGGVVMSVRY